MDKFQMAVELYCDHFLRWKQLDSYSSDGQLSEKYTVEMSFGG